MDYILYVFVFLLGTIVGSFLNVVALRYNTGFSILGRSSCFSCGNKLSWWELLPLVSFIYLGGKCSRCGSKISWQYPLVEFTTGLLFLFVISNFQFPISNLPQIVFNWIIWSILVVITVYDFRHKIIPDGLVYTFITLGLIQALAIFLNSSYSILDTLNLLAGPILFVPFFLLWFFSQGKWLGLGDGKLALGIGFMLGLSGGVSAIILGFWIGAAVSLALLALEKFTKASGVSLPFLSNRLTIKSEIPFGPFLILGTAIVFFFGVQIINLNSLFNI